MATDKEWSRFTDKEIGGKKTGNAEHACDVRATPLEADAILDLVMENLQYANDHYYYPMWRPVEMRVQEYLEERNKRHG